MKGKNILVIGSSNTDMVIKTLRFPLPGETIIGGDFFMNQGRQGSQSGIALIMLDESVFLWFRSANEYHIVQLNLNY